MTPDHRPAAGPASPLVHRTPASQSTSAAYASHNNKRLKWFRRHVIVISRFLKRYSKAKRTGLFTSAATNQRGVSNRGGQEKLRSDFQNTRRDRVAVKVGVVQVEKANDQMGQGRSV